MYHNGYSITGSVAGGAITGGMTYAGGKALNKYLKGSSAKKKVLSKKAFQISDKSPQLSKQYTSNIKNRLIDLGLQAEELAIKNTDDLGINKSDEIMKLTDQYIDNLQLKSPQLESFLREKIHKGGRKLSVILSKSADFDELIALGLENGSIPVWAAENTKENIKADTEEYISENSVFIDEADFDKALDKLMDGIDELFESIIEGAT